MSNRFTLMPETANWLIEKWTWNIYTWNTWAVWIMPDNVKPELLATILLCSKSECQVSGAPLWNELTDDIVCAPSLSALRRHLKTYLIWSIPTLLYDSIVGTFGGPCSDVYYLGHSKKILNWTVVCKHNAGFSKILQYHSTVSCIQTINHYDI